MELVEFQKIDSKTGLVFPWFTHPFLDWLETIDLSKKNWLEIGGGLGTSWLRKKCEYVVTVEVNEYWIKEIKFYCHLNQTRNGLIIDYSSFKEELNSNDFDIISVDGMILRDECMIEAVEYFKKKGGVLIADNYDQDFVWTPSDKVKNLMKEFEAHTFIQPNHENHEGKAWNTTYWVI